MEVASGPREEMNTGIVSEDKTIKGNFVIGEKVNG